VSARWIFAWWWGLAVVLAAPGLAGAQADFVPGPTSYGSAEWRESVASAETLPTCDDSESQRVRAVRPPDAQAGIYQCIAGDWEYLSGGSGSGDVTAVGNCTSGACFQAVTARHALLGPSAGGVAAFRAIEDADLPASIARDSELPTDTTCNDAGVACLFAGSASEGGPATTALAFDADPAGCDPGDFVTDLAADGTPVCATPSGGVGGSTGLTDRALILASGTGGSTVQAASAATLDANGKLVVTTNTSATYSARFIGPATGAAACAACGEVQVGNCDSSGLCGQFTFNWNDGWLYVRNAYASGGIRLKVGGSNNVTGLEILSTGPATFPSTVKINGMTHHGTRATAPAACIKGDHYSDTSGNGGDCFCGPDNTWNLVFPVAPVSEDCS
jgi:hypothetical protein